MNLQNFEKREKMLKDQELIILTTVRYFYLIREPKYKQNTSLASNKLQIEIIYNNHVDSAQNQQQPAEIIQRLNIIVVVVHDDLDRAPFDSHKLLIAFDKNDESDSSHGTNRWDLDSGKLVSLRTCSYDRG